MSAPDVVEAAPTAATAPTAPAGTLAVDRLLFFSDAVFAISATLLVLDIRVPPGLEPAAFRAALIAELPAVAAYAFSFAVIGQLWLVHHFTFSFVARVTNRILVYSLLLLGLVAFLPFPVRLLSDYHEQPAALTCYVLVFTLATGVQRILWVHVSGQPQLLVRPVPEALRRHNNMVLALTPIGFGVLIPFSLLVPRVAIIVGLLLLCAVVTLRIVSRRRASTRTKE